MRSQSATPSARARGIRPILGLPGLLLALFALALQMAAASVVPWQAANAKPLDAPICHVAASGQLDPGSLPAPGHRHDCVLCPLCQAISHAGVVLHPATIALAAPVRLARRVAALPPARAPPPRRVAKALWPRGPPQPV